MTVPCVRLPTVVETHLVDGVADPVDAGIAADGLVLGVNEDNLEVLVGGVLVDPVGVQDTQVGAAAANTLLSGSRQSALVLELVDTLVGGLAVGGTLGDGALAATAADTDAVDDVALLGLVAETASLVGARGARSTVDSVQLTQLYLCTLSKVQRVYSKTLEEENSSCVPQKSFPPENSFEPPSNTRKPGISYGYARERSAEMLGNRGGRGGSISPPSSERGAGTE